MSIVKQILLNAWLATLVGTNVLATQTMNEHMTNGQPVALTACPMNLQLVPRDRKTNMAKIPVEGSVSHSDYDAVVLNVYKADVLYSSTTQILAHVGATPTPFRFKPEIRAELTNYDFELVLTKGDERMVVKRVEDVVAGDVFIVQGQSNANSEGDNEDGTSNFNQSPFVRAFGISCENNDHCYSNDAFYVWALGDGDKPARAPLPGRIGQWPLRFARVLSDTSGIPVAIMNGSFPNYPIQNFKRNDLDREDLNTNYGRLLHRMRRAGLDKAVRAILYYQGESDRNAQAHEAGFLKLCDDWMEDYPGVERVYVHQIHVSNMGPDQELVAVNRQTKEVQRHLSEKRPYITVMSTSGINGHNGIHFHYNHGYELIGDHMAALVMRDLYGAPDHPNITAPDIQRAYFSKPDRTEVTFVTKKTDDTLTFDPGAEKDFHVSPTNTVTVLQGAANGNKIILTLSTPAPTHATLTYMEHIQSGPWVTNSCGIGLLGFLDQPILPSE